MNSKVLIGVIALVVLVGGGFLLMNMNNAPAPATTPEPTSQPQEAPADATETIPSTETTPGAVGALEAIESGTVKEFTVSGSNFKFEPATMTVKKGDTVRITFKNVSGTHDFVIDELKVATKQINGGQSETVEFVATKAGTFEYYCSVGQHRQLGMKGTLTVQ